MILSDGKLKVVDSKVGYGWKNKMEQALEGEVDRISLLASIAYLSLQGGAGASLKGDVFQKNQLEQERGSETGDELRGTDVFSGTN